jgi:aryl-alcohol dehydrogenase-like predicted oxidoreductase
VTTSQAKAAAAGWLALLDQSLRELGVERIDAYYLMASSNPTFIRSDEVGAAFAAAKAAGKTRFVGLSSHQNAEAVLDAAAGTGWYDLAMIAITPAGWYDWTDKRILPGSKPMAELQPTLARARKAGIALVGMKAGRLLAGRGFLGRGDASAFDRYYDPKLLDSGLSPFQRSYAYVLAHGLDVVNADMQSFAQLEENVAATASSGRLFA